MIALLKKEITGFLGNLTGYIVLSIFLLAVGLILWVFESDLNIPLSGYAGLEQLFLLAPWVFMFLIPAITMRSFAEEKRQGTMEWLLTRPLSEWQIILAKYLAGLLLTLLALLPTLVYFYSVYRLANPVGNVDTGAVWGSYLGLIFLASGYLAIGLFASSLTDNQIISFILALFLCFICYVGFDSLAAMEWLSPVEDFIQKLGISFHFSSMSRGVIDTRDVVYFLSFTTLFLALTRYQLLKRTW